MLQLGKTIAQQLGEAARFNLLANWMAHYLAEMLSRVDKAQGEERERLSKECVDLILRIWAHRQSLPPGTRPLEAFEPMFQTLEALNPDRPRYRSLQDIPDGWKCSSEVKALLSAAISLDASNSAVIRYLFSEAVQKAVPDDERWAHLQSALAPSPDLNVVIRLMGEADTVHDRKRKIDEEEAKRLKQMIAAIEAFANVADAVGGALKHRLSSI